MTGQSLPELTVFSICLRLLLATLVGGIVGIERGRKRRAAGFRTHMLVCMGSALIMITNQYLTAIFNSDPARLGAQVISGIGFLGAGTIIVTSHNQVKGLTTAAGLWASAGLGLTIGIGFWEAAAAASVLVLLIITVMHRLDTAIVMRSRNMDVYVEFQEDGRLSSLLSCARKNAIRVVHVEIAHTPYSGRGAQAVLVTLRLPKRHLHSEVLDEFLKTEGIFYVEEI